MDSTFCQYLANNIPDAAHLDQSSLQHFFQADYGFAGDFQRASGFLVECTFRHPLRTAELLPLVLEVCI